jgi:type IV pilus assembly protein PilV
MNKNTGFTLIEVLISMLILAIGLLGLGTLQTSNIRHNLAAYNRGQAVQLLYDMADRMRANNCKTTSTLTCPSAPAPVANYVITDTLQDSRTKNKTAGDAACVTVGNTTCNATLLSTYDLIEWSNAITNTLPSGRGCINLTNGVYTLYVTWDDDRSGVVDTDGAVPTGCASTFTVTSTAAAPATTDPIFSIGVQL